MANASPTRNSLKKFEVPINRFTKTALPLYLELLEKHQKNITKFQSSGEWEKAKKESLNAQRTATQLRAAIEEMECVRGQLLPSEVAEFDRKLNPYKKQALAALDRVLLSSPRHETADASHFPRQAAEETQTQLTEGPTFSAEEIAFEQRKAQLETYQNLQADIEDIHQLITDFAAQVQEQGSTVNQVEEHVETVAENVSAGERFLAKAAKIKTTVYPLTGALIGGCLGGPVGLVAGLKIGGLAAVGGTLLGFTSGHAVKKLYEKKSEPSNDGAEVQRSSSMDSAEPETPPPRLSKAASLL